MSYMAMKEQMQRVESRPPVDESEVYLSQFKITISECGLAEIHIEANLGNVPGGRIDKNGLKVLLNVLHQAEDLVLEKL